LNPTVGSSSAWQAGQHFRKVKVASSTLAIGSRQLAGR